MSALSMNDICEWTYNDETDAIQHTHDENHIRFITINSYKVHEKKFTQCKFCLKSKFFNIPIQFSLFQMPTEMLNGLAHIKTFDR